MYNFTVLRKPKDTSPFVRNQNYTDADYSPDQEGTGSTMNTYVIALTNVLMTLFYIVPGFLLCRFGKAKSEHLTTISGILVYGLNPFLIISSFISLEYNREDFRSMALFFVASLLVQVAFIAILVLFLHKKYDNIENRILTVGSVMGNVGFFGIPLIRALIPQAPVVSCYATMYIISMNILIFTFGIYCLTKNKKYISVRSAILNPTVIGFLISLPIYFFSLGKYFPAALINGINVLGSMTTPVCMMILGIRLATMPFKSLFARPRVFVTIFMKLCVFPIFCWLITMVLPFDYAFKGTLVILSATPCASVLLSLSEIHRSDPEFSANTIFLTTILSFITLPLIAMIVL